MDNSISPDSASKTIPTLPPGPLANALGYAVAVEILRRALWAWLLSAILVVGFVLVVGALSPGRWEVRAHGTTPATVEELDRVLWQVDTWTARRGEVLAWTETESGVQGSFRVGDREEQLWLTRTADGAEVRSQRGEVSILGQVMFEDAGPLRTVTWTRGGAVHDGVLARFAARFAKGRAEIALETALDDLIERAEMVDVPVVPVVARVRVVAQTWPCPGDGSCAVGRVIAPMEAAGTELRLLERVPEGAQRCVILPDALGAPRGIALIECPPP